MNQVLESERFHGQFHGRFHEPHRKTVQFDGVSTNLIENCPDDSAGLFFGYVRNITANIMDHACGYFLVSRPRLNASPPVESFVNSLLTTTRTVNRKSMLGNYLHYYYPTLFYVPFPQWAFKQLLLHWQLFCLHNLGLNNCRGFHNCLCLSLSLALI